MSLRFSLILFLIFIANTCVFAQETEDTITIVPKTFKSLAEASAQPDSVFILDLRGRHLKEFPKELFSFKNLEELDLSKNRMKELPEDISKLQHLKKLNLANNDLKKLPNAIGALINLHELNLNRNIIDTLPESIGKLTSLEKLWMWDNELSEIPDEIKNLKNLREFELRGILFSDEDQKRIHDLLPDCVIYFSPSCACKN